MTKESRNGTYNIVMGTRLVESNHSAVTTSASTSAISATHSIQFKIPSSSSDDKQCEKCGKKQRLPNNNKKMTSKWKEEKGVIETEEGNEMDYDKGKFVVNAKLKVKAINYHELEVLG
ncbi:unnamed protein product [Dovyalis caffra]|uniref:Uncharacterized protein n=1 Tax=Dovyalis caffra TaxID=77055 RepID=A0AAV1QQA9_9ROSI|nr:unnamed protein product [Dovyalis caffra]